MTAVPLIFVFIEWFSRRVNGVFRCRGGNVPCSRIVSVGRCISCSSLCACCRCGFSLVCYFLCVSAVERLFVSLFVCLHAHSFPRCPHLGTRVGANLRSIEKVDAERQMVANASVVERTEVGAEGFGERTAAECFEQRWESEEMNRLWGGVELHCGRKECGRDEDLINATPFAAKIIATFDVVVSFGRERSGV